MDNKRIKSNSFSQLEEIKKTRDYLRQYSVFRKLWEKSVEDKISFGNPTENEKDPDTNESCQGFAISKMFEIRRFVMSIRNSNERTLLFLYYIHGENFEDCARRMQISDRTARRLHHSALRSASLRLCEYIDRINNTVCYE